MWICVQNHLIYSFKINFLPYSRSLSKFLLRFFFFFLLQYLGCAILGCKETQLVSPEKVLNISPEEVLNIISHTGRKSYKGWWLFSAPFKSFFFFFFQFGWWMFYTVATLNSLYREEQEESSGWFRTQPETSLFLCVCSRYLWVHAAASSWMSPPAARHRPSTRRIMSVLICTYPVGLMHGPGTPNFAAQFEGAGSSGTIEGKVSASQWGKNNRNELLSGYMSDGPADGTQGGGNEKKKRCESERETEGKNRLTWWSGRRVEAGSEGGQNCPSLASYSYFFAPFFYPSSFKTYPRVSVRAEVSPSGSMRLSDSWAHRFCPPRQIHQAGRAERNTLWIINI